VDRQGCGEVAVARPYEAQNHCISAIVGAAIGRPQSFTPCLPQKLAAPQALVGARLASPRSPDIFKITLYEGANMELFAFQNAAEYEKAMLQRYKTTPNFINNKSGVQKIVCDPKGAFFRNSAQKMIGVTSNSKVLCQCILIKHKNFNALTVAFFEAEENATDAVDMMMEYAAGFAKEVGAARLLIALDGHCNYSIGLSIGDYDRPPLFGENRNPDYYNAYFQNGYKKLGFSYYSGDFGDVSLKVQTLTERIGERMPNIETHCVNLRMFKKEMKRYTDLSNQVFGGHWYYYRREYDEDYELFNSMKPLLSSCNLIFAVKDGIDIGYAFLYPDFNQLISAGSEAGVWTYIRHKLLGEIPTVIKIVEIAVLPEHHSTGTILTLFAEGCRQIRRRYPQVNQLASSWIADDNLGSKNITKRFAPNLSGSYAVYEKEI